MGILTCTGGDSLASSSGHGHVGTGSNTRNEDKWYGW